MLDEMDDSSDTLLSMLAEVAASSASDDDKKKMYNNSNSEVVVFSQQQQQYIHPPMSRNYAFENNFSSVAAAYHADSLFSQGVVRFPCRARNNASEDHNPLTAYFCIPINNAMHAIELICSHLKCQMEGVKFRFCAHCRMPAAKRNFSRRHLHGIPHVLTALPYRRRGGSSSIGGGGGAVKKETVNDDIDVIAPMFSSTSTSSSLISSFSSSFRDTTAAMSPPPITETSRKTVATAAAEKKEPTVATAVTQKQDASTKIVPQAWIDLYHSRPAISETKNNILLQQSNKKQQQQQHIGKRTRIASSSSSPSPATKHWLQRVLAEVDPNIMVTSTPPLPQKKKRP